MNKLQEGNFPDIVDHKIEQMQEDLDSEVFLWDEERLA